MPPLGLRGAIKPKPTAYEPKKLSHCLSNGDLLGFSLGLFLFGKEYLQHAIFILGLYTVCIDAFVQGETAFKILEREFLADSLVVFGSGFIFLFIGDSQQPVVNVQLDIFLAA